MAIKYLTPRSKEEIIKNLEGEPLDKTIIEIIKESDPAYKFVTGFIFDSTSNFQERVNKLNGLLEIIRFLIHKERDFS
jgi:hypothetical protein